MAAPPPSAWELGEDGLMEAEGIADDAELLPAMAIEDAAELGEEARQRGNELFRAEDWAGAAAEYEASLSLAPSAAAGSNLAAALLKLQDFDGALQAAEAALSLHGQQASSRITAKLQRRIRAARKGQAERLERAELLERLGVPTAQLSAALNRSARVKAMEPEPEPAAFTFGETPALPKFQFETQPFTFEQPEEPEPEPEPEEPGPELEEPEPEALLSELEKAEPSRAVEIMNSFPMDPQVGAEGCKALYYLAQGSEVKSAAIAAAGGIETVVRAMDAHRDVEKVQMNGCLALRFLSGGLRSTMIKDAGGEAALRRAKEAYPTARWLAHADKALASITKVRACAAASWRCAQTRPHANIWFRAGAGAGEGERRSPRRYG